MNYGQASIFLTCIGGRGGGLRRSTSRDEAVRVVSVVVRAGARRENSKPKHRSKEVDSQLDLMNYY